MNRKTIKVLEYEKIKEILREEAASALVKEKIADLFPFTQKSIIEDELRSTTEGVDLIANKGPLPIYGIYDIEISVGIARKGGTLSMRQLLEVGYNINTATKTKGFLKGELPEIPKIISMGEVLADITPLYKEIDRCIISEDEMADNASSTLRTIRKSIIRLNEDIKNRLNKIISSSDNKSILQDSIVTLRDGRYVIPVKSELGYKVPGIVHDKSKGGATLFIEPQVIVDMNNQLRQLEIDEIAEVNRILSVLSDRVSENYHNLMNNQKLMMKLDYIMAKSKLSIKLDCKCPTISDTGEIDIIKGRHPLIDSKKVVPTTVEIGKSYKTLVITGPNTGGKTVTLKTIGLMVLMAQSGLHIPAEEKSKISIFQRVYADIGDEQSIEQSLSTFSSHMKNIVEIMDKSDRETLILLDELGAGTDPTEGAALAIAIMESLRERGATTVATTHYNEIKKYALATEGVENASMEFNVETLSPTYRLTLGIPGKSNAFEISRKLGLSGSLIDRATDLIENKDIEFEQVLTSIEEDKKRAEEERDEAIFINISMKKKQAELEEKEKILQESRQKSIDAAKTEARDIIREARNTARETIKELKALEISVSPQDRQKIIEDSKRRLKEQEKKYITPLVKKVNAEPVDSKEIKVGTKVKVLSLEQNGMVVNLPDSKGDLQIQVGIMKLRSNLKDLVIIVDGNEKKSKNKSQNPSKYGNMYRKKAMNITSSVDVRGMDLENAIIKVGKYLDDAFIAGLKEVTIVHGWGEGILREGIRKDLKRNPHVARIERAKYNEGGEGATIVKIKD